MQTYRRRSMSHAERNTSIKILCEVYGRLPKSNENRDFLWWQQGRTQTMLACLDMAIRKHHHVGLWAWPSYTDDLIKKAYEAATRLTAAGIPRRIYRAEPEGVIKVEDEIEVIHEEAIQAVHSHRPKKSPGRQTH